jgi:hypothetical protein
LTASPRDVWTPGTAPNEDVVLPPPSTVNVLSPPPENYLRHAGHTPGLLTGDPSVLMNILSPRDDSTPKQLVPIRPHMHHHEAAHHEETKEDRSLKGPLGLGTKPENTLDVLQKLDEKLQDVKDHPEQLKPAVLKTIAHADEGTENEDPADKKAEKNKRWSPHKSAGDAFDAGIPDGPRLKLKQSLNFGAPLGSLRPLE